MENFIEDAIRTESQEYHPQNPRIVHAILGIGSEAGELLDPLKRAMFYGEELDLTNLKEESGDILWYLAVLFSELDTTFGAEMYRVIRKLKVRFPEKFSKDLALNRKLSDERKQLELD